MSRMSKKMKREWDFFIDHATGRRKYNDLCRRCTGSCKQSYQARVLLCGQYQSKRTRGEKCHVFDPYCDADPAHHMTRPMP